MKVIGLTGSFGTGKTFVASVFKSFGAKIVDADTIAHEAVAKGTKPHKRIVAAFGKKILDKNGEIDRTKLGAIVFSKKANLKKLDAIVHPEVIRAIRAAIAGAGKDDVVVIDAPLLAEAGLTGIVDKLVVVAASTQNQITRCTKKFKISREEVLRRIKNQMSLKKKVTLADFVIDNDGTKAETRKIVKNVWRKMVWK